MKKKKNIHGNAKWRPEYNKKIVEFFQVEEPFREHMDDKGKVQLLPTILPLFENFANNIGVSDDALVQWAKEENKKKYPGFQAAYLRAKELQRAQIIQGAMSGSYNNNFSIFLAKNVTNMKDTQVIEGGDPANPIHIKSDFSSPEDAKKYLESAILSKKDKAIKKKK